jgi:hypothetical protein
VHPLQYEDHFLGLEEFRSIDRLDERLRSSAGEVLSCFAAGRSAFFPALLQDRREV